MPLPVTAQEFRAALIGKITDQQGAALPGATVEVANVETSTTRKTLTNDEGNYSVLFLDPGRYRISAELPGFKRATREGIVLQIADRVTIDLKLEVGEISEQIVVVAETPLLDSDSANAGQLVDHRKTTEYPLNGRNIFMMLDVAAGVFNTQEDFGATGSSGTRPFDNLGASNWSINGSAPQTSEFLLDGAPNSVRGRYNAAPTVDAIGEFRIQTSSYDAQYGRTGAGVINMSLPGKTSAPVKSPRRCSSVGTVAKTENGVRSRIPS
jgi:hypothetical protein